MTATSDTSANRYLQGNFAPVRDEVTITELAVTGAIPDHLDGRYVRNGPNPVVDPDPAAYHWFVGTGMVHGVRIRGGRAEWYRNRWVRSADVAAALGEQPRPGPVHADMDFPANTNVVGHAGRTFAIVEAGGRPYELTDDLDTVGPCDFDGTLPGGYTAHPHRDPATGELHAMSYFWGWGDKVQYSVLGTDGRIRRTVDIPVHGSPMMHDFSLTDRHVVVYDLPATFDLDKAARGGTLPYTWDPDYPARVGVMARDSDGTDVRWFEVEPCYVYHPLNAYEDGDQIVLDVVRHPKTFATDHQGPSEGDPTLDRWTVDLAAGKVREERLDDRAQEFPRLDERLVGKRHRYGYAVGAVTDADGRLDLADSGLVKHDLVARTSELRSFGAGAEVAEFVFVPTAPDAAEDDGVLVGYVVDAAADRTDLVLVDAATLETVAQVHLPVRVPTGFHGNWIPNVP
ncbi:MAG: carotenoid oxygenase family protein [Acidimicrobiales bacterium]